MHKHQNLSGEPAVAAYFKDENRAEGAIRELKDAGFRSDEIAIGYDQSNSSFGWSGEGDDYRSSGSQSREHRGFWERISDFFTGEDDDVSSGERRFDSGRIPPAYQDRIKSGGVIVMVYTSDRIAEAESVLRNSGGDIDSNFWQTAASSSSEYAGESRRDIGEDGQRLQLLTEVLRVHKTRVPRGEARLRKEVITEQQNVQVPVSREELVIERVPIEGEQASSGQIGADSEIRVPLSEERVEVEKRPVVKEEVRVGKRMVEENRNVSEETRREELRVEGEEDGIASEKPTKKKRVA